LWSIHGPFFVIFMLNRPTADNGKFYVGLTIRQNNSLQEKSEKRIEVATMDVYNSQYKKF